MTELEANIREELKEKPLERQMTFAFFNEMEKEQVHKDYKALQARLDRIPAEKGQE